MAGVAIPIVIHLLYRKHQRQTDWAAMELLRKALVERSGQVRLEDYLLLFLRGLTLLLIAAALLRPTVPLNSGSWLGRDRLGAVIAIDASFSMNHGEHSRYERALEKAKSILAQMRPGDPVTLVLMSQQPKVLQRSASYDASAVEKTLDDNASASNFPLGLDRNLEHLVELVQELKTPTRECFIITDAQGTDWNQLSDAAQDSMSRLNHLASVFVLPVATDGDENLSITRLDYASGSLRKSGIARYTAKVVNAGRQRANGTIELFVNNDLVARRELGPLEPNESKFIPLYASFEDAGDVLLKAQLKKRDELSADDSRFAVAHVRDQVRVLCVDDGVPDSRQRTDCYYAIRALRLRSRGDDEAPLQVEYVASVDLSLERLSEYDVILLANVAEVAPEMVSRLRRFVEGGGGVVFFPGNRVRSDVYNNGLASKERGILPARLIESASASDGDGGWGLAKIQSEHPVAGLVAELSDSLIDTARFTTVYRVSPHPGTQTVLKLTHREFPLLISHSIGQGAVLMFTTSADRDWSELPLHPIYTMLVQQAVTQLTSHPARRHFIAGEFAIVNLPGEVSGGVVRLVQPDREQVPLRVTRHQDQAAIRFRVDQSGYYRVERPDHPTQTIAVNVDAGESIVRTTNENVLSANLSALGIETIRASDSVSSAIDRRRYGMELSSAFLVTGVVMFLLQGFLARYFTRRMDGDGIRLDAIGRVNQTVGPALWSKRS